jgi:hypothetical protein
MSPSKYIVRVSECPARSGTGKMRVLGDRRRPPRTASCRLGLGPYGRGPGRDRRPTGTRSIVSGSGPTEAGCRGPCGGMDAKTLVVVRDDFLPHRLRPCRLRPDQETQTAPGPGHPQAGGFLLGPAVRGRSSSSKGPVQPGTDKHRGDIGWEPVTSGAAWSEPGGFFVGPDPRPSRGTVTVRPSLSQAGTARF